MNFKSNAFAIPMVERLHQGIYGTVRLRPWTPASTGMTVRGFARPAVTLKLRAINYKKLSGFISRSPRYSPFLIQVAQRISEFKCREWSLVLIPDRSTRLIGHSCCFKSWIRVNTYSSIALTRKFMPLVAFSRPLCDLPLCCQTAGLGSQPSNWARISVNRLQKMDDGGLFLLFRLSRLLPKT
jgi:hypothetical protein